MTRLSSSANQAAVIKPHVPYALFVYFNFVSGAVRLTSWDQDYTWGGNTYQSIGKLGAVGNIAETADLIPQSLAFTLAGIDSAILATALTEKYHNRDCQLFVGWLDANNNLVDTPYMIWEGYIDSMSLHSDANQGAITVTCENRLILWSKIAGWMYTDTLQKQFFSGDSFFNLVASLPTKTVAWGGKGVSGPVSPPPNYQFYPYLP